MGAEGCVKEGELVAHAVAGALRVPDRVPMEEGVSGEGLPLLLIPPKLGVPHEALGEALPAPALEGLALCVVAAVGVLLPLPLTLEDPLPVTVAVEQALPLPLLCTLGDARPLAAADPVTVPTEVVEVVAVGVSLRVPPPVSVTVGDTEALPDWEKLGREVRVAAWGVADPRGGEGVALATPEALQPLLPEGGADLDTSGEEDREPKEFCVREGGAVPLPLPMDDTLGALGVVEAPPDTLDQPELLGVIDGLRVFTRGGEGVPLALPLGPEEVVGALKVGAGEAVGATWVPDTVLAPPIEGLVPTLSEASGVAEVH